KKRYDESATSYVVRPKLLQKDTSVLSGTRGRALGCGRVTSPVGAHPRVSAARGHFVSRSMIPRLLLASRRSIKTSRIAIRASRIDLNLETCVRFVGAFR